MRSVAVLAALLAAACDAGMVTGNTGSVTAGDRPDAPAAVPVPDARVAPPVPDAAPAEIPDAPGWQADGQLVALQLTNSAFPPPAPTLPNMIVYVPKDFDPTAPLDILVYIHGFNNCISNAIRAVNGPCLPGGAAHNAYSLALQLDASRRNTLLLLPEVAFQQASGAIGKLANNDSFLAMIDETLAKVAPIVRDRTATEIDRIVVASHSGGYTAAAAILDHGGLPVDEMWLLDSLYAEDSIFDTWVKDDEDLFLAPFSHRLASIYTDGGGTLDNTQAMAGRAAGWFAAHPDVILDDRTTATLTPDQYGHGMIFKRTALAHDDVPRYYFQKLLESSVLPAH